MRRVVVTGMGLLTSIGNNKQTSWNNLINAKSGIKKIKHFNVDNLPSKIADSINRTFFIHLTNIPNLYSYQSLHFLP